MSKPIAVITGASKGIGATTALTLAENGYDLFLIYGEDHDGAAKVAEESRHLGANAEVFSGDISERSIVEAAFAACDKALGTVSLLVNNAGVIGGSGAFVDLTEDGIRRAFDVNVCGTIFCAQAAARRMSAARGGKGGVILNLSSIAAVLGSPGEYVHYAASKGAVETLTIGLAKELGPQGIRVNAIRAGTVDTTIHQREGNPDRPAQIAKIAPLRRVGTPEDIAQTVLWLASDQASYVTGAILPVSGGV